MNCGVYICEPRQPAGAVLQIQWTRASQGGSPPFLVELIGYSSWDFSWPRSALPHLFLTKAPRNALKSSLPCFLYSSQIVPYSE